LPVRDRFKNPLLTALPYRLCCQWGSIAEF
jgi:hypothetical protein